ncbi:MAG TPA: branched-chain amino acid ABC transporter ATP-binding protein/permease [Methylomirabilota bacterium]|nr:branched-chain amino acid ABC transporter ATP-binding protein/permease [Methylomirabilota bacterium]
MSTRAERVIGSGLGALLVGAVALVPVAMRVLLADDNYWLQVVIWVLFFAYLSAAWNLIGGFAGQYSIGHAGFLGIGAYTSSLLAIHAGLSPWLGMLAGGLVAAAAGGLIGYPCFRLRGAFFSLVTIAFAEMLRVGTELTDSLFGLEINGVRGLLLPVLGHRPAAFQFVDKRYYYYVILALLLAVLAVGGWVKRSRLGYYLAAIGDDEDAVASLGVNPARAKLAAMLLSAFFTALAGTFYAQFILFITPTRTMSLDFSVQMVIMAVLGGLGSVLGPVYGAVILVPIAEGTRAVWGGGLQGVHLVVYGGLLMVVILYAPQGVEGWVRRHVTRLVRRLAARLEPSPVPPAVAPGPSVVLPEGRLFPPGRAVAGSDGQPLLVLRGLSRRFGGAVAVRDLSLEVHAGEAVGLIGPNGAGKTTVFNLITGVLAPHAGRIAFGGVELTGLRPDAVNRLGIARTFQIVRPFARLSARDNVVVAALPRVRGVAEARREAERCLAFVGLAHRADVPGDGLSTGERKRLELARALATRPRLLLLDEVMGGVDQRSLPGLIALIQRIKGEGVTLLVIEHNLRVVSAVADRLVMLHLGEKVAEGPPDAVVGDPRVVDIYVGGTLALR